MFGSKSKKLLLSVLITGMFLLFIGRLCQLQLVGGEEYGKRSEENSIKKIIKDPVRGAMYDRNRNVVVDSRPSYTLTITPSEFQMGTLPLLAKMLDLDTNFVKERLSTSKAYSLFMPVKIKHDLDFRAVSLIEENRMKLPGVDYQVESKRYYPMTAHISHLLGYVREVSEKQISEWGEYYRPGDLIGYNGLEADYERVLRGEKGYEFLLVNSRGKVVSTLNNGQSDVAPVDGWQLYLSLDSDLQAYAEQLLQGKIGAIVAIDPNNGELLAMVSKPDYALPYFSGSIPANVWNKLNTDERAPLFNRATLTRYPPGSTFKMVLASAALAEGIIDEHWTVQCAGSFQFGDKTFRCHGPHGAVNVAHAIEVSCNVFFYNLMLKVGLEKWAKYGKLFGFGEKTGFDILEESPGLLPSEEYFDRVYGKHKWTKGFLISLAIGQGEVGVTPLQMACYTMALANHGAYHQPHTVRYMHNSYTGQNDTVRYQTRMLPISKEAFDNIRKGMYLVVNGPGGTGTMAQVHDIQVAGKTGTAQNPHGDSHSWFIAFAPYDHPKIAIAVLVENAGAGGSVAAPIAAALIEKYLYGNVTQYEHLLAAKHSQNREIGAKEPKDN
jgi:penicillin-binding protein 2